MNNLTNALSETSSKARSVEILTKRCIGIRLRFREHAVRFVDEGLPEVFGL
jgi:hypothetical protein